MRSIPQAGVKLSCSGVVSERTLFMQLLLVHDARLWDVAKKKGGIAPDDYLLLTLNSSSISI